MMTSSSKTSHGCGFVARRTPEGTAVCALPKCQTVDELSSRPPPGLAAPLPGAPPLQGLCKKARLRIDSRPPNVPVPHNLVRGMPPSTFRRRQFQQPKVFATPPILCSSSLQQCPPIRGMHLPRGFLQLCKLWTSIHLCFGVELTAVQLEGEGCRWTHR